jgi:hypothetical protein
MDTLPKELIDIIVLSLSHYDAAALACSSKDIFIYRIPDYMLILLDIDLKYGHYRFIDDKKIYGIDTFIAWNCDEIIACTDFVAVSNYVKISYGANCIALVDELKSVMSEVTISSEITYFADISMMSSLHITKFEYQSYNLVDVLTDNSSNIIWKEF